jgi:hypothetical protein
MAGKWMCAQRRPLFGIHKVVQTYQGDENNLPDYLILMDDDTYFNLEEFPKWMTDSVPEQPRVVPGCLLRYADALFTLPYGGMSTMFNKASLAHLMRPIQCPDDTALCGQIQQDTVGERHLFRNGMSLVDLMHAFVSRYPYREHKSWNTTQGYCMHSDWTVAYFVNFYNVSRHVTTNLKGKFDRSTRTLKGRGYVANDRMEAWDVYYDMFREKRGPYSLCKNDGMENCRPESLVCHYIDADGMKELASKVQEQYPDRFKKS